MPYMSNNGWSNSSEVWATSEGSILILRPLKGKRKRCDFLKPGISLQHSCQNEMLASYVSATHYYIITLLCFTGIIRFLQYVIGVSQFSKTVIFRSQIWKEKYKIGFMPWKPCIYMLKCVFKKAKLWLDPGGFWRLRVRWVQIIFTKK